MPDIVRKMWGHDLILGLDDVVREGNIEAVKDYLERGHVPTSGTLIIAIINRHMEIAKLLIENYSDAIEYNDVIAYKDSQNGMTALMHAAESGYGFGDMDLVKLLLEKGADIDAKDRLGRTALIHASMKGKTDIIELLIKSGADATIKDDFGNTASRYAAAKYSEDFKSMMMQYKKKSWR